MADTLLNRTTEQGLELILPEGVVTWRGRGLESTIDLVFALEGARNVVIRCGPREDLQFGSDYTLIGTELE